MGCKLSKGVQTRKDSSGIRVGERAIGINVTAEEVVTTLDGWISTCGFEDGVRAIDGGLSDISSIVIFPHLTHQHVVTTRDE